MHHIGNTALLKLPKAFNLVSATLTLGLLSSLNPRLTALVVLKCSDQPIYEEKAKNEIRTNENIHPLF
jgi:hypothetical protein